MSVRCFLCGETVDDHEEKLIITTEYGGIEGIIHRGCYDYDYRTPLDRDEIVKKILVDST